MTPTDWSEIVAAIDKQQRRQRLLDCAAWAVSAALWIGTARLLFPSYFPF